MVIRYRYDAGAYDRELTAAGAGQLTVLAALAAALGLHGVGWLAGLLFMLTVGLLTGLCGPAARAAAAGPANRVTLARGTLVGGVTALVVDGLVHGGLYGTRLVVLVVIASVALVAGPGRRLGRAAHQHGVRAGRAAGHGAGRAA